MVKTTFSERNAELAPEGQWLAYQSDESGRLEIYVRPFPNVDDARWQVSTGGGRTPLWSRNGQELFYVSLDGVLMGMRIEAGSLWRADAPVGIIADRGYYFADQGSTRTFDIAADGRRFLMIKGNPAGDESALNNVIVVQSWFEELKRLVPTNSN